MVVEQSDFAHARTLQDFVDVILAKADQPPGNAARGRAVQPAPDRGAGGRHRARLPQRAGPGRGRHLGDADGRARWHRALRQELRRPSGAEVPGSRRAGDGAGPVRRPRRRFGVKALSSLDPLAAFATATALEALGDAGPAGRSGAGEPHRGAVRRRQRRQRHLRGRVWTHLRPQAGLGASADHPQVHGQRAGGPALHAVRDTGAGVLASPAPARPPPMLWARPCT